MDYSILFVCLMGMGTVFFGLACLIVLTMLLGRACASSAAPAAVPAPAPAAAPAPAPADQQALVAAISAAVAEELGTDVSGIRILSLRKL